MRQRTLVWRSLQFYWRTNIAILLGVVIGTTVIGGALIVGDSVRGSLRQLTLKRLGNVDHALFGQQFFREDLVDDVGRHEDFADKYVAVSGVLKMSGSVEQNDGGNTQRRAGGVDIYGVDESFWNLVDHGEATHPAEDGVVLNSRTARALQVDVGDRVSLWVELPSSIPRDALLGDREEVSRQIDCEVTAVLSESAGLDRFGLNASQQRPLSAFLSLRTFQQRLDLSAIRPTRRRPDGRIGRINAMFVHSREAESDPDDVDTLNQIVSDRLQLQDVGLKLVQPEQTQYVSLQSEQLILESRWEQLAGRVAGALDAEVSPVLIYLANEIRNPNRKRDREGMIPGYSMYSMIAGLNMNDDAVFGEYEVVDGKLGSSNSVNDIVLNSELARALDAAVGDEIDVSYYTVGNHGQLPESKRRFRVQAVVAMKGAAVDKGLVPAVDGITDQVTIDNWRQPFPMSLEEVPDVDEEYWDTYRAIPKAFVSLTVAQNLWKSRYGELTAVRIAPRGKRDDLHQAANEALRSELTAESTGLFFRPVKAEGLQAAVGANNFAGLFVGFSFFLIASAGILIALLFRLNLERRSQNLGLLSAVGLSRRVIRVEMLTESVVLALSGSAIGCVTAIGYAELMVYGLGTWWVGATGTSDIELVLTSTSVASGAVMGVVVSLVVVALALRETFGRSVRQLLVGEQGESSRSIEQRWLVRRLLTFGTLLTAILVLVTGLMNLWPDTEAFGGFSWRIVAFFVVGLCLLTGCLLLFSNALRSIRHHAGQHSLRRLAFLNAARNPQRSVLTCGLIAFGSFVIVAVAAGHRNPAIEYPDRLSGNGGFVLLGESTQPILKNLNSSEDRELLNITSEDELSAALLRRMQVEAFDVRPGEDASCLNLYQTTLPTILGAPPSMIERGGFRFADTPGENPWELLEEKLPDEDGLPVVPVLGDMNTLKYSLKLGIGDSIDGPSKMNPEFRLRIVGMFDASIFQGVVVMSADRFGELFPQEAAGDRYFLIGLPEQVLGPVADNGNLETLEARLHDLVGEPTQPATAVSAEGQLEVDLLRLQIAERRQPGVLAARLNDVLESSLNSFGFDAVSVAERLASFLAVQNTYLSTFQTLAGLGLLLGTLGLAAVMLRNVLDRRAEFAVLRAVGFRSGMIGRLVLLENGILLLWGLGTGTVAALIAMLPHLRSTGADVPWTSVCLLLISVAVAGMLSALVAVRDAVGSEIVGSLRGD